MPCQRGSSKPTNQRDSDRITQFTTDIHLTRSITRPPFLSPLSSPESRPAIFSHTKASPFP